MSGKLDKEKNVEAEFTMLCYFLVSTYLFYAFYSEIPFPNVSYVLSTNAIKQISVILVYLILYSVVHFIVYKWNSIPNAFGWLFGLAFFFVFMTYCFYDSQCVSETKSIFAAIFNFLLLILGGFLAFWLFLCILEGFSRSNDESNKKEDDEDGKTFIEGTFLFITIPLLFEYYPEIQLLNIVANGFFKLISVIAIYTVIFVLFLFILEISTKMSWLFSLFRVSTVVSPFAIYFYCPNSTVWGLIWFVLFVIAQNADRNESNKKEDDEDGKTFIEGTFLFITIPLLFEYYPEIQLLNIVANGFFKLISVIAIYTVIFVLFIFILETSTKKSWLFSLIRVSTVVSPFAIYFYCPNSTVWGLIWFVLFVIGQNADRNESKSQNQTYTYVSCDDDDDDDDESYYSEADDEIYELRREHERLEAERREEQRRKEAERREAEKRIVSVAQKGSSIRIYGNRGFLGSINAGNNGVLQGYTSDTVTVRRGRTVYLYNYRGQFIRSHFIS